MENTQSCAPKGLMLQNSAGGRLWVLTFDPQFAAVAREPNTNSEALLVLTQAHGEQCWYGVPVVS